MEILFHPHAERKLLQRGIARETVLEVVRRPHQRVEGHSGRWIYQSRIQDLSETGETLLRVVVEEAEGKILILTIYSTSQVDRYWQGATPR
jgi:hypothetical protein